MLVLVLLGLTAEAAHPPPCFGKQILQSSQLPSKGHLSLFTFVRRPACRRSGQAGWCELLELRLEAGNVLAEGCVSGEVGLLVEVVCLLWR